MPVINHPDDQPGLSDEHPYNLHRAIQRFERGYINSLKICRYLKPEYLVKLHGNNPVTTGRENVRRFLTDFSDAIQFVHDQTVQYMNKGFAPGEIKDLIKLPSHPADRSYLQET